MQYRKLSLILLTLCFSTFSAFQVQTDDSEKERLILHTVLNYLEQGHFLEKNIDDAFSESVYGTYLDYLDGGKRFFIQSDIAKLEAYQLYIDDQIRKRSLVFFDLSDRLKGESIVRANNIFEEISQMDFDFSKDESIEFNKDKLSFPKNEEELKSYWRKAIKYRILNKYYEKLESTPSPDEEVKSDNQILEEARTSTIKLYKDWFNRLSKMRRSDRFQFFINSITEYYGPHTSYFSPKRKSDFDIKMGGKLEGIGARLTTDGEETKVTSIVIGGPAWKGKELEVNDIILAVTQNQEPTLELIGMRLDDVIQKIRGKKGTIVTLSIRKSNGEKKDISITRDVINFEETFAKSLILDIPDHTDNIGYIQLPKFYSSFEREGGNSCAIDVAKEIEKLKDQNVNGIILDLRNNLGGSLGDVIDMTGLFIKSGPIVQVKSRTREPVVYPDPDPEVKYEGPLVVLVNEQSASASEILAAAIQDYNRGVIVGSKATFGKGTVQQFYDLDRGVKGAKELKPFGQVKMTMQKYYRVNGGSVQLKGVASDIVLPGPYQYMDVGEREYENALSWSQINPAQNFIKQDVYQVEHMDLLRSRSESRINRNEQFKLIEENSLYLKETKNKSIYPLDMDKFKDYQVVLEKENERFEDIMDEPIEGFLVSNLTIDQNGMATDSIKLEKNENWIRDVKKDIYLQEAMFIIADMQKDDLTYQNIKAKE